MQQEQQGQRPERKGTPWLVIILLLIIAGVGGFFAYTYFSAPVSPASEAIEVIAPEINDLSDANAYMDDKPIPERVDAAVLPPIEDDEHFWGEKTSPVAIVMYGNLTGAYSRLLLPEVRSLVDSSNGSVHLVFRNYPLTENPLDYDAAELGECVYVQLSDAGYWEYVDQLLAQKPASLSELLGSVTTIGADSAKAQTCLDGEDTWDYVVAQKQEVQLAAKIFVAPSFIIANRTTGDARIVEGLVTRDYLQAVIEEVR